MSPSRLKGIFMSLIVVSLCLFITTGKAAAQQSQPQQSAQPRASAANMNVQIYLLVASSQQSQDERLPQSLDEVMRELRSSLPFRSYRVMTTLVNRVQDNGKLDVRWISNTLSPTANDQTFAHTPSFTEFHVDNITLSNDAQGRRNVRLAGLGLSTHVPILTGTLPSQNGPSPVIQYESVGLSTNVTLRENEPSVVGSLNIGTAGDAIILIVSVKQPQEL